MKSLTLRRFVPSAAMVLMAALVAPALHAATAFVTTTTDVVEGGLLEIRLDLQSTCAMSNTQDNIIVSIEYLLNGIDPSTLMVASTSGLTALKIDGFDFSQGIFLDGQFAPATGATSHTAIIRVAVADDSEISQSRSMETVVRFLDSGMSFPQGVNCIGGNGFEDLDPPFSVVNTTIVSENDQYQVRVSDARDVTEGDSGVTAAVFTVSVTPPISNVVLRGGTTTPVIEIQYGTDSRGLTPAATAGSDYQQVAGTDTLTVGKSSFQVSVPVVGDIVEEPDEYFSLFIVSGTGTNIPATVLDGRGDARIVDDDVSLPTLEVTVQAPDMPEGDSGTTAFPFEVALSRPIDSSEGIVTLSYRTVPGTASPQDDFLAATGTLDFQFGSFTTATIEVPVVGDDVEELDETFSLELSVQQGVATIGGNGSFEATIRNDDLAPVELTFVSSRYTASESGGRATIRVARSGPSVGAVSVLARTNLKGSATAGDDYRAASARLEWADGDASDKFLEVSILDDNESEDEESVGLVLKSPSGAILGAIPSATLRILDQDEAVNIEVVGDSMVALRPGSEIQLEARVTDEAGNPIAGEQVMWTLVVPLTASSTAKDEDSSDSKIELIGGETSISDIEGVARKRVSLGASAGSFQVVATLPGNPDPAVFEIVVGDLVSLFDPDTGERSVAEVLDSSCRSQDSNFRELCGYLFSLENDDERRAVIREIVPREIASQGVHTLDLMVGQLRTIGTRIASVRKGQNSQVDSQVAMQLGDDVIQSQALEALARATLTGNATGSSAGTATVSQRRLAAAIDRALGRAGDGGTSSTPLAKGVQDDAALEALEKPERWGFFVNGRYSTGDRRDTARGAGFGFDSLGVTVAVDYRLDDRFLVGAAAGFLDTSSDVVRDGGGLEADNKSLTLYASGAWKRSYVDAIVLYGRNDYALTRNIDLPRPYVSADSSLNGVSRFVARSDTSGDQLALNASYGFDVATGMTNLSLFARGYYLSSTIDAFTERGAGPFNLVIQDQDLDSLLGEAGLDLTFNVSLGWGVLQPAVRASYLHEFEDDARQIRAQFQADPALTTFVLPTDFPDSGFVNLGVSLTAVLPQGRSFFVAYDTDLERDFVDLETFTGGFRLSF